MEAIRALGDRASHARGGENFNSADASSIYYRLRSEDIILQPQQQAAISREFARGPFTSAGDLSERVRSLGAEELHAIRTAYDFRSPYPVHINEVSSAEAIARTLGISPEIARDIVWFRRSGYRNPADLEQRIPDDCIHAIPVSSRAIAARVAILEGELVRRACSSSREA